MHVMHYLSYQYVHKSQLWVPQSQCRCVKILSQIYAFLADYSILQYSYNKGTTMTASMSFSLVEDNKILWLCPSVASLGLLSNSYQELGTMEVDSLLVLTALLIATDRVCVAVIFYLMPA